MNRIAKISLVGGAIVVVGATLLTSQESRHFEASIPPDIGVHIPHVPQSGYEYPVFPDQTAIVSATGTLSNHNLIGRIGVVSATRSYSI